MKIILVRHGESVDDIIDCFGGAADFPLNETGKKEAEVKAKSFETVKVDKIYSSPLKRAMQTADAINSITNCELVIVDNLKERNSFGVLTGCNKDDAKELFGYLLKDIQGKPGDYYSDHVLLGAEPHVEFDQRVKDVIGWIVADALTHSFETIIVVTHGNVTRSIYKNLLDVPQKIEIEHVATTVIEYSNNTLTLVSKQGITIKE